MTAQRRTRGRALRYAAIEIAVVASLAVVGTATGCGKAGPPKPPESELPEPVKTLTVRAARGAVELSWPVPQKNQDGSKPADVVGFQVQHALLPINSDTAVTQSKPVLAFTLPLPVDRDGLPLKDAVLRDSDPTIDTVNVYRVAAFGSAGYGTQLSNAVSIAWTTPPAPPTGLTAQAGERSATLSWTAPSLRADAKPEARALAFRVYRWAAEAEPELVTSEPIGDVTWTDSSVVIDRTYNYVVRSVVRFADVWIESDDSATASLVSEDRTPPPAPSSLVAVRTAAGIELRWEPSTDSDVAGYYVYRLRTSGAGDRLTPDPITSTRFLDAKPALGAARYRVTAVDRSARPNESPPSVTVGVE